MRENPSGWEMISKLSVIAFLLFIFSSRLNAQTIDLIVFPGLSTIDFAAFNFASSQNVSPRILQIVISPPGMVVYVEGKIEWKRNERSGFEQLVFFKTSPFIARSFFNDEFNNTDIDIESTEFNSNLTKENMERGKPTGVYGITFRMFDKSGRFLDDTYQELSFLNPTPPQIILPVNGSSYDVGSVMAQWNQTYGASFYKILANVLPEGSTNFEEALSGSNPIINNKNVGNVTAVNLKNILDREWIGGQTIVMVVKAIVLLPGKEEELKSEIISFKLNPTEPASVRVINPDLARLANLLAGQISQDFLTKLSNGEITIDQIQFSDEKGNTLTFADFVALLNFLEQNKESIISINFTAK